MKSKVAEPAAVSREEKHSCLLAASVTDYRNSPGLLLYLTMEEFSNGLCNGFPSNSFGKPRCSVPS